MKMRFSPVALALACAFSADAAAQQRFGPSLEASLGLSAGSGGTYTNRAGGAMDAVLALPMHETASGALLLAFTGTANGPLAVTEICVMAPGYECLDAYPAFLSLGVLAGVQRPLARNLSVRALAGPAYFQAVNGEDAGGAQARVDVAREVAPHLWLTASLRAALVPNYGGESLGFGGFGLGLRVQ